MTTTAFSKEKNIKLVEMYWLGCYNLLYINTEQDSITTIIQRPATLEEKLRLGNTACRTIYTTDIEDEKLWEIAALMAL